MRDKMLQSSNIADVTMDVKIQSGVIHEFEATQRYMLDALRQETQQKNDGEPIMETAVATEPVDQNIQIKG